MQPEVLVAHYQTATLLSPFALKEFQMSVPVASAHICASLSPPSSLIQERKKKKSIRLTSHHKQLSPKG